ncbi:septal ring lytic transglycosylase RlpA family protein [Oscillatoria sp. CS-180]|uniref:septal ring lytic transglycosylase RlpA family protein n=1 Tax=Oscillatoria sp. CS-180 TaxID=3021720 RepID=UPI00232EE164|nr:septal ring lytic transglycosylase RlpA family protein [Oscillatoria sp. CS-180]MDB9525247.1 septal ring lytic transglycosylase RlpA family protein [Oscillatoria sp. CS-180]
MNRNLCRSFATAVLVCAAGIPLSASAEEMTSDVSVRSQEGLDIAADATEPADSKSFELIPENSQLIELDAFADPSMPSEVTALQERDAAVELQRAAQGEVTDPVEVEAAELPDIVDITAHDLDGVRVAILSVDSLPVLTFVEEASDVASTPKDNAESESDVDGVAVDSIVRAEEAARQIGEFYQSEADADAIRVRWETELEEYVVSLDGETLVLINDDTQYFNTTGNHSVDALQATNRLRALLGGATPLREVEGRPPEPEPEPEAVVEDNWGVSSVFSGQASWYGPGFHGRHTASGEVFNQNAMTAAHRTLPFGTRVRVTNLSNNRQVVVRINDRGPFSRGRVIDLSAAAAREIGLQRAGVGPVRVEVLSD